MAFAPPRSIAKRSIVTLTTGERQALRDLIARIEAAREAIRSMAELTPLADTLDKSAVDVAQIRTGVGKRATRSR